MTVRPKNARGRMRPLNLAIAAILAHSAAGAATFSLPAQPLALSLRAVGSATNTNILFDPPLVKGLQAPELRGEATTDEAITRLLAGTGIRHEFMNDSTVVVGVDEVRMIRLAEAPASDTASAAAESSSSATNLTEVVVTAQKRAERLQDVPISISVLGGTTLDRSTTTGITETLNRIPGIAASEFSAQGGGTQLAVRGVSASAPLFSGSSPIAYYLDSVPFGLVKTAIAPDANAYDLDRVEVLRGPQGTLYGSSALNGVVRVLTKDADLSKTEFKARASLSTTKYGGESYRGDAALNLPLITDKLAARVVVGYEERSGWIDKPGDKDANDAQPINLRLKINAQPTEAFSVGATLWHSKTDQGAPNAGSSVGSTIATLEEPITTEYDLYGLKVSYDFGRVALLSSTSYLNYSNDSGLDLFYLSLGGLRTLFEARTFAQELNLISDASGAWRWSAGGIYRDGTDRQYSDLPNIFSSPSDQNFQSKSFAVFGELTRMLMDDRLSVSVGLRYFEDRLTQEERSNYLSPPAGVYARPKFDNVSPRAVVSWYPSRQLTIYGSYGEGFRSGSAQEPTVLQSVPSFQPVKPDDLKNYEVGLKGTFWEGRITVDAAVFYTEWKDLQQILSVNVSGTDYAAVVNAGSASGPGVDFGVSVSPIERLSFAINVGWNDLEMDEDLFSESGGTRYTLFAKGERLDFSPELTAGVSADYEFPLGGNGYSARIATSVNHTSKQQSRIFSGGVIMAKGDDITIGRASFTVEAPQNWSLSAFVDNLNNEEGAVINGYAGAPSRTLRIRPRTVGVQFEYHY